MPVDEFYDEYWKSDRRVRRLDYEWSGERVEKVLGPLFGKENVLDYGCGIGKTYRPKLSAAIKNYSIADVSRFALETLKSAGHTTYLINPDDSTISAEANSFDGLCSIEVIEHLNDPLAAAREMHRVLKPGGTLVATVPNFGYHAWRLMALLRAQVPSEPDNPRENRFNGVHIRFFSATLFKRLFTDAGFHDVQISSFDDSSIWDVTRGLGPAAIISDWARKWLPPFLHLRFLQDIWPGLFACRLRVVATKTG